MTPIALQYNPALGWIYNWLRSGSQIKASPGLDIKLAHYYCLRKTDSTVNTKQSSRTILQTVNSDFDRTNIQFRNNSNKCKKPSTWLTPRCTRVLPQLGHTNSPSVCKPSRLYGVAYLSRPSKCGIWEYFAKQSYIVNGTAYSAIYKQKYQQNIRWLQWLLSLLAPSPSISWSVLYCTVLYCMYCTAPPPPSPSSPSLQKFRETCCQSEVQLLSEHCSQHAYLYSPLPLSLTMNMKVCEALWWWDWMPHQFTISV